MGGVERLPVPCMDARRLARASLPSGKQGRVRSCIRRFDAAPTRPLGLMKSADRPPIKASRFAALGTGRVLSIPGATGLPSGHDHPYASSNLRASSCRGRHLFSEWPFLDEAVEKRICRVGRADLRSQIAAGLLGCFDLSSKRGFTVVFSYRILNWHVTKY